MVKFKLGLLLLALSVAVRGQPGPSNEPRLESARLVNADYRDTVSDAIATVKREKSRHELDGPILDRIGELFQRSGVNAIRSDDHLRRVSKDRNLVKERAWYLMREAQMAAILDSNPVQKAMLMEAQSELEKEDGNPRAYAKVQELENELERFGSHILEIVPERH